MAPKPQNWLRSPNVSWRWLAAAIVLWCAALITTYRSEAGKHLESWVSHPLDFALRERLGQTPALSSSLKIFSIDDSTFAAMDSWVLTLDEWVDVLEALAKRRPKAIVIDAMFRKGESLSGQAAAALKRIEQLGVPVIVGAFVTHHVIGGDPQAFPSLSLNHPDYDLSALSHSPGGKPASSLPPMLERLGYIPYGTTPAMQKALSHIGHISYQGFGMVAPLIHLDDNKILPHVSLFATDDRRIEAGQLLLNGHVVPLGESGELYVNFPSLASLEEQRRPLGGLLHEKTKAETANRVQAGDVVLLLPLEFTGGTDFKNTPVGIIPGGYIIAATLNSVITGNWLKPIAGCEVLIFAFALLGAFIGMRSGPLQFWTVLLALLATFFAISEGLFAYQGVVVPWLFPTVAFMAVGVTVFAEKTRVGERKAVALRASLEGTVAPGELDQLLRRPEGLSLEARERVVTLMFIDVVGFSLLAEEMLPRTAFDNLKQLLLSIGDTVHQYGGVIDKTLGDGLLCYFGYRLGVENVDSGHAEKALACALKIQHLNVSRNLDAIRLGEPVYPLRIGVNTASCYLGDLGSGTRIDFTVVGNGVNFAKRLEGACEIHKVLVGGTTHDLVKNHGLSPAAVAKRLIRIKHHSELVVAYEFDPFESTPQLRLKALEGFRHSADIKRLDHRWPVHDPSRVQLTSDFGEATLVNFSVGGLSLKLPEPLAMGTHLSLTIDAGRGALRTQLLQAGIELIQAEVRWVYAEAKGHVHGVLLTNVQAGQAETLVRLLCEFAFSEAGEPGGGGNGRALLAAPGEQLVATGEQQKSRGAVA